MSKLDNVFLPKMTHYFKMSYLIHFLFNLSDLKKIWVHQVKLYITSLSFKCKEPIEKNHKKHKCTKLEYVN